MATVIRRFSQWGRAGPRGRFSLAAFAALTGQRLWLTEVRDRYTFSVGKEDHWTRTWPLHADLDGDGRAEIVIPEFDPADHYSGVRALDAVTGETRWVRPMTPYPGSFDGLVHLLEGPDLDRDGTKDLVAVWRMDSPLRGFSPGQPAEKNWLYVDALSGKDGHGLWWWRGEIGGRPLAFQAPVRAPFWCGRGPDGWPLLAVALGGDPAPGVPPENPYQPPDPPIVHLLAASTGQEVHTVMALSWPQTADLDGDGLGDIWGSVEGKLRALRGPAPETWRALGKLQRAGDLDGDGICDVLSDDLEWTPGSLQTAASRTVLARSGRDGHLLWKTRLDAREDRSFWPEETRGYILSAPPMPAGDLDRDGTPDVLVSRQSSRGGSDPPASLPLEILSGRSGRHFWSAGSIPPLNFPSVGYCRIKATEARVCEPGKPPDLIVVYTLPEENVQWRLARLSGRDGGFVWDTLLFEHQPGAPLAFPWPAAFGDLDGDGCLDATLPLHFVYFVGKSGGPEYELRAFSLRDGKLLWRRPGPPGATTRYDFDVGDLDGDGRAEIVLSTQSPGRFRQRRGYIELAALEGNDGSTRWTWHYDYMLDTESLIPHFALGDLDGKGRKEVCISLPVETGRRLVILDGQGQERIRHDRAVLPAGTLAGPSVDPDRDGRDEFLLHAGPPVDLDGDGRDELLLRDDKQLSAFRGDLTGLWAWRDPPLVREILPAERGRPATVLLKSGLGLDGVTGRAIWSAGRFEAVLTDQAGTSGPRVLDSREGATVCRLSIPTSGEGTYLPPHAVAALPARAADDPRWERPLPWVWSGPPHRQPLLQLLLAGTLINVGAPLLIFWLATRRARRSVRLLLALPAMVAIAMTGLSWLGSPFFTGAGPASYWQSAAPVAVLSLLGVPLLAYAGSLAAALWRGRWRRLLILAALTASATALMFGLGLYFAIKQMPAREHYTYAGWYHIAWFGAYAVGVLLLFFRPARAVARVARRPARRIVLGVRRLCSRRRNRTAASDPATPPEERPCVRP